MKKDQWARYRRTGESPLIHKRSIISTFSAGAVLCLSAWIVLQPPGMNRADDSGPLHVTLPAVLIVGKRALPEPMVTAQSDVAPAAHVVAEHTQP
jgi:hypothetical protein